MKPCYDVIAKWANEALQLLQDGNLDGVKTNLSWIHAQAKEYQKITDSTKKDLTRAKARV